MACGELGSIVDGNLIHDYVVQNGYIAHVTIANALISMYVKMGRLDLGHEVFSDLVARDVVSWNTLITGYAQSGNWVEAFDLFLCMREGTNEVPNKVTLLGLLSACGQAENLGFGMSIHGHLIRAGLLSDFRLGTAVVDMYAKCESFDHARAVFEEDLLEKTLVSWNSLIAGYTRNGYAEEAVILYEMMTVELKLKPDSITFSNVVPAYASLANHGRIQSIHSLIVKKGFDMDGDVVLGTAMIDAYGKCLDLKAAKSLFTCIEGRNTATWNALIAAYNMHSHADQVMPLFVEMNQAQELFDAITMVILCQSCGELRSLKQGSMVHGLCHSKGFNSHLSVGNSIVDMYIRCGCVDRAEAFFNSMPFKNIVTWNILFCGYVRSGHSATAIRVFRKLQLENLFKPDSVTIISFIQASATAFSCRGDLWRTIGEPEFSVIWLWQRFFKRMMMVIIILLLSLFVTVHMINMTVTVIMITVMMSILLLFLFVSIHIADMTLKVIMITMIVSILLLSLFVTMHIVEMTVIVIVIRMIMSILLLSLFVAMHIVNIVVIIIRMIISILIHFLFVSVHVIDMTVIVIMIRMMMSIPLPFLFVTMHTIDMTVIVLMITITMSILLLFLFMTSVMIMTMIIMTIVVIIVKSLCGILIRHKLGSFPPFFDQLDEFHRVYIASNVYQSLFAVYTN
ncbi:hypothetical protein RJ639_026563 [Escallonia herrerae]|uniref:Pentatricopeptide repeat-containing protein n=1 Tax=Escallonia herrerae TaxID=1293975 RepID=A0AA89AD70_9ASTE|nr:hypothetical protein RJ639_026563 [Escallonia herrerae]